ncbi:biotin--[acetyl-CoA-carboxylase] ligase [Solwaraspora sp. WMMD406]|uniref:biotin--[acetyl-CoA-carboxylase] ligase n=1 Tax=Solwaraspora sp. WMMD406 TaxID=3016095 RepID=UPI002415EA3C|nr:biotin--[acetyl-CoA-carboxylase] ligase [Solwaraspora sp. WMMD406]MDG4767858.1 biotin--[acetyl-CoA-carboxylase] ligase [Solwaraspora sp. WMMD406]
MAGSPYTDLDRPPLNGSALRRALLTPDGLWTEVRVLSRTGSTNADVIAAARTGAAEGLVVTAEQQTAGRGRLGRDWVSPPRAGLAVSLLLRPGLPRPERGWPAVSPARYGWLPLLAGVALAEAVLRLAEVPAGLKWPNDLLIGEAKCAGILAETVPGETVPGETVPGETVPGETASGETASGGAVPGGAAPAVVLGIGLNVTVRADELPSAAGTGLPATSLRLAGAAAADRDPLLRALLRGLESWYGRWRAAGGDASAAGLRTAFLRHCVTVDRRVRVSLPTGAVRAGVAVGVDDDGRLVVRDADGDLTVAAGDVLHVRPGDAPGNGTHG